MQTAETHGKGNLLASKKEKPLLLLRVVIKDFHIWQNIETGVTGHFTEAPLTGAQSGESGDRGLWLNFISDPGQITSPSYASVLNL